MKRSVPPLDIESNINHAPHVVILGAGLSLAAFPDGDRNGFQLPLMNNLIDIVGLAQILERHGIDTDIANFEEFYDELVTKNKNPELLQEIERTIRDYFCNLELVDQATLYDYLLLSLREKDLIATFNWDPFLAKAYQRNVAIRKLPRIVYLHGNVAIGVCETHKRMGCASEMCPECNTPLRPSRLLFPVKQKNYSEDPFIKNQWEILRWHLNYAYLVTIFGYSAPMTDIEAKNVMLSAWKDNPTRELAQFNIVDIKNREELKHSWKDFSVRQYNGVSDDFGISDNLLNTYIFRHPCMCSVIRCPISLPPSGILACSFCHSCARENPGLFLFPPFATTIKTPGSPIGVGDDGKRQRKCQRMTEHLQSSSNM